MEVITTAFYFIISIFILVLLFHHYSSLYSCLLTVKKCVHKQELTMTLFNPVLSTNCAINCTSLKAMPNVQQFLNFVNP